MYDQPVTTVAELSDVLDPERIDGREVRLLNVEIVEVLGDTAFYVTEGVGAAGATGTAPTPGAAQPGQPDPGVQQPGATQPGTGAMSPGMGTGDQRVLVVRDTGLLGGTTGDDEFIRVGQNVDVYGEARTWDDRTDRMRAGDGATRTDTQTQPGVTPQDRGIASPGMGMDRVYVAADRIEPATHTAPGAGPGTTPGTAPGATGTTPGATGTDGAQRSNAY
jgi:hypothetical protein